MPKDENLGRRFTMRVDSSLGDEIEKYLEKTGMSLTEFIRRACHEKLDRDQDAQISTEDKAYVTHEELMHILAQGGISIAGDRNKVSVKK